MRLASKLAVPVALILALSACAPEATLPPSETPRPSVAETATATPLPTPDVPVPTCPSSPVEVKIDYELTVDPGGGVVIDATTNLPDGAEMNASFFVEGGYFGQDEGTVQDGEVSFGPFSDKGTPLRGSYDMSITLPIARDQLAGVQDCLGAAGEMLTGPLVSVDDITGDAFASLDEVVTFG